MWGREILLAAALALSGWATMLSTSSSSGATPEKSSGCPMQIAIQQLDKFAEDNTTEIAKGQQGLLGSDECFG
jgi:hypothetical protein